MGIIGVVAALTIPSLVAKHQKKVFAVQAKKTYSEIAQALNMAEVEYGSIKNWDVRIADNNLANSKAVAEKYIIPYLKGVTYCDSGYETKCGKYVSAGTSAVNYILQNGSTMSVAAYIDFPEAQKVNLTFDINGIKLPNKYGKDELDFIITDKFIPYGWKGDITREEILNGYRFNGIDIACNPNSIVEYKDGACTALLFYDGWEIKEDYPW